MIVISSDDEDLIVISSSDKEVTVTSSDRKDAEGLEHARVMPRAPLSIKTKPQADDSAMDVSSDKEDGGQSGGDAKDINSDGEGSNDNDDEDSEVAQGVRHDAAGMPHVSVELGDDDAFAEMVAACELHHAKSSGAPPSDRKSAYKMVERIRDSLLQDPEYQAFARDWRVLTPGTPAVPLL